MSSIYWLTDTHTVTPPRRVYKVVRQNTLGLLTLQDAMHTIPSHCLTCYETCHSQTTRESATDALSLHSTSYHNLPSTHIAHIIHHPSCLSRSVRHHQPLHSRSPNLLQLIRMVTLPLQPRGQTLPSTSSTRIRTYLELNYLSWNLAKRF